MMSIDFVQEIVEENRPPRLAGCLTGWEVIVFEMEDEPEPHHPERSERTP